MSSTTILTSPHQGQEYIDGLVDERKELRLNGDFVGADAIYTELCALGVVLSDSVDGTTTCRLFQTGSPQPHVFLNRLQNMINPQL